MSQCWRMLRFIECVLNFTDFAALFTVSLLIVVDGLINTRLDSIDFQPCSSLTRNYNEKLTFLNDHEASERAADSVDK